MKYIFRMPDPFTRFVNIELIVDGLQDIKHVDVRLPAWRPGRYELVNFAKNIRGFNVSSPQGEKLNFKKTDKDTWRIFSDGLDTINIHYEYFAAQPDAGACFIDRDQLYINPVHCCFSVQGREKENYEIEIKAPSDWRIACGLPKTGEHLMMASDFETLVDSPFICSPSLKHGKYEMDGIEFNIWIQGECNPDWNKIISDFMAFTRVQLDMMKHFPSKDYHFLVQLLPYAFYHGVEHLNSTVLAMGPGIKLMEPGFYSDFTGVASHELFHVWNVKSIRPVEMYPYHYNKENYATTGYVYEGVTTYYGDLFLGRSGFFNVQELLDEYSKRFQKHMDNPGRFNYSVAESSFDTWLDGYVPGIPGRKVSIYDEGCLLAWALDFMIRSATDSGKSLNDVMYILYHNYAQKGKGYSDTDYRNTAEEVARRDFNNFFEDYIFKADSLDTLLSEVLSLAGITIEKKSNELISQRVLGARIENRNNTCIVTAVYPGSPMAQSGVVRDDEIVTINDVKCGDDPESVIKYQLEKGGKLQIKIKSFGTIRSITVVPGDGEFYPKYRFIADKGLTSAQIGFRNSWLSV